MKEEVYEFFKEYGFNRDEIHYFQDENEKMFFTNLNEVKKNIAFLTLKGLNKDEIMQVLRVNPYLITVKDNRLEALDRIYFENLKFNKDEIKKIIVNNSYTYTSSPVELNKNIDYLKEHNCSFETIKKFFISYPTLTSKSFKEFKESIKFN